MGRNRWRGSPCVGPGWYRSKGKTALTTVSIDVLASYFIDAPSGATIVLLTLVCFMFALPLGSFLRRSS